MPLLLQTVAVVVLGAWPHPQEALVVAVAQVNLVVPKLLARDSLEAMVPEALILFAVAAAVPVRLEILTVMDRVAMVFLLPLRAHL